MLMVSFVSIWPKATLLCIFFVSLKSLQYFLLWTKKMQSNGKKINGNKRHISITKWIRWFLRKLESSREMTKKQKKSWKEKKDGQIKLCKRHKEANEGTKQVSKVLKRKEYFCWQFSRLQSTVKQITLFSQLYEQKKINMHIHVS